MIEDKYLMGIDAGCTVIKAVIFDVNGNELAVADRKLPTKYPAPDRVERDMDDLWNCTKDVIKQVMNKSKIDPDEILGIGVSGHGDGLYLLDKDRKPVRNGVLSFDTRALSITKGWEEKRITEEIFSLIGQKPHAGAPVSILAWIKQKEEDNYHKIRWILFCKDFIKYKLTNVICTDETDPSATLVDVKKRRYSDKIFEMLSIEECKDKLPEIVLGWEICGEITAQASGETGLKKGTPVASGLHDVDATALGSGCLENGQLLMIVGTWAINEIILDKPVLDPKKRCLTRTYGAPNRWLLISASPSSAVNLDWFVKQCCGDERFEAERLGLSPYALCDRKVETTPVGAEGVIYHPFLYGSSDKPTAKAGFYGIAGWHTRAHLLRALYEGVALATRMHIEELKRVVEIKDVRIAGGGARSNVWTQIFADAIGYPIKVPSGTELGARGAAMCAGIAVGVYKNHKSAIKEAVAISRKHTPSKVNMEKYKSIHEIFKCSIEDISHTWDRLHVSKLLPGNKWTLYV